MKKYEINYRADGRVEIVCPHGTGHPSKTLTEMRLERNRAEWKDHMGVHGCDGCCRKPAWVKAEKGYIKAWQSNNEG